MWSAEETPALQLEQIAALPADAEALAAHDTSQPQDADIRSNPAVPERLRIKHGVTTAVLRAQAWRPLREVSGGP